MSTRASRCQSACGSQSGSRRASRCSSRRGSQTNLAKAPVQPLPARSCYPMSPQPTCRVGCTACCPPPPRQRPCPVGIYVERVKSLKPLTEFVPSCSKMDGLSTYREFYYPKCGERVQSYKPAANFDPSCAKFCGLTTYREFYYPKCGPRSLSCKPASDFDPSCAKFEGLTTYKNDYVGAQSERVKSLKPATEFDPSCAKMDGITTYRVNYIPYCPRELGRPGSFKRTNDVDFSCAPFDGMTTYRGEFWCKPIVRVQSLKPAARGAFSDAPFADRTTYKNDFPAFHFDKNCGSEPCMPQCFGQCPSPMLFCANTDACTEPTQTQPPPQKPSNGSGDMPMPSGGGCCVSDSAPPCCPIVDKEVMEMEGEA